MVCVLCVLSVCAVTCSLCQCLLCIHSHPKQTCTGEVTLRLNDFSKLRTQCGGDLCLTSKPFEVGGHVFEIKIFPSEGGLHGWCVAKGKMPAMSACGTRAWQDASTHACPCAELAANRHRLSACGVSQVAAACMLQPVLMPATTRLPFLHHQRQRKSRVCLRPNTTHQHQLQQERQQCWQQRNKWPMGSSRQQRSRLLAQAGQHQTGNTRLRQKRCR